MRKLLFTFIALLVLIAGSALAQDVTYNFDKNTDFSKFKTYKWVNIKGAQKPDALTDKQIKEAIDAELSKKGLTKTDADNADLYIGYQPSIGEEKQITTYNTGWGYGPGWGAGYHGGMSSSMSTGQTSTILTGQLVLDMYDSANHDLVWRGIASKTLDPKAKPEKRDKNIQKAAAKLLKNYPPPKND